MAVRGFGFSAWTAALTLFASLAFVMAVGAGDAQARCPGCPNEDRREPKVLAPSFPSPSGGRFVVERIVLLTDRGVFTAPTPERTEALFEERVDLPGLLGDTPVLGRAVTKLFPRSLLAYVRDGDYAGPAFRDGYALIVDLVGAHPDGVAVALDGGVALLTRSPFRHDLVGMRLDLRFAPVTSSDAPSVGARVGDAYWSPSGLVIAPPLSQLPGF